MRRLFILFLLACCLVAPGSVFAGEVTGLKAGADSFKRWGAPDRLVDGDLSTAWVAGRSGEGTGDTLNFTLPASRTISRLRIANGNQEPGKFARFRCVTSAVLVLPDRAVHWFHLRPEQGEQEVVFPPVTVKSFTIVIAGVSGPPANVFKGADKVALSEVRVFDDAGGLKANVASGPVPSANLPVEKAPAVKPGGMDYFSAIKPGAAWLRTAVPAGKKTSAPKPVSSDVQPWMRDLVHGYFNGLASLDDAYLDIFAESIREREARALSLLREDRAAGRLPVSGPAKGDATALVFGKPIVRGNAAMVAVKGIFRFTGEGRTFEFRVNAKFSFVREGTTWRINGVSD
ncbi:NADase-type glycan-binding domain-containing protein [Pseudodesulfovibrio sp.]|uniref:NADase-type glycan-binding domain-containing protein n=1 Tax=unclassified Pseudodesulfovibrio TaxID=2661612 RepID=UPI003B00865B